MINFMHLTYLVNNTNRGNKNAPRSGKRDYAKRTNKRLNADTTETNNKFKKLQDNHRDISSIITLLNGQQVSIGFPKRVINNFLMGKISLEALNLPKYDYEEIKSFIESKSMHETGCFFGRTYIRSDIAESFTFFLNGGISGSWNENDEAASSKLDAISNVLSVPTAQVKKPSPAINNSSNSLNFDSQSYKGDNDINIGDGDITTDMEKRNLDGSVPEESALPVAPQFNREEELSNMLKNLKEQDKVLNIPNNIDTIIKPYISAIEDLRELLEIYGTGPRPSQLTQDVTEKTGEKSTRIYEENLLELSKKYEIQPQEPNIQNLGTSVDLSDQSDAVRYKEVREAIVPVDSQQVEATVVDEEAAQQLSSSVHALERGHSQEPDIQNLGTSVDLPNQSDAVREEEVREASVPVHSQQVDATVVDEKAAQQSTSAIEEAAQQSTSTIEDTQQGSSLVDQDEKTLVPLNPKQHFKKTEDGGFILDDDGPYVLNARGRFIKGKIVEVGIKGNYRAVKTYNKEGDEFVPDHNGQYYKNRKGEYVKVRFAKNLSGAWKMVKLKPLKGDGQILRWQKIDHRGLQIDTA